MKYVKQLDSLRAIAVICVITTHWISWNNIIQRITNWSLGDIGVNIFFVLSGFLITKILLDNRDKSEKISIKKSTLIKNFYIRRTLRIFPIYYLTITLLLIFQKNIGADIQSPFLYLVTYTSNFYFFKIQTWGGMLSHLWSLAVEEQFYLVWPLIILFVKRKYLLHIIVCFILIGTVSQYLLRDIKFSNILTITCFDAFGLGALLSWQTTYKPNSLKKFYSILSIVAIPAALLFLLAMLRIQNIYIPFRTIVSIISLWVITYIFLNKDADKLKFKFILNNRVLIFLGKISYGMYLYHNILPYVFSWKMMYNYFNHFLPDSLTKNYRGPIYLLEHTILLILISWLSYTFIEKRFLSLKKIFRYQNEKKHIIPSYTY